MARYSARINGVPQYTLRQCCFITNNQLKMYLKQHGLKLSGRKRLIH